MSLEFRDNDGANDVGDSGRIELSKNSNNITVTGITPKSPASAARRAPGDQTKRTLSIGSDILNNLHNAADLIENDTLESELKDEDEDVTLETVLEKDATKILTLGMEDSNVGQSIRPNDRYYTAYFIFMLLGAGFLFPWNTFLLAADYFAVKYPTSSLEFSIPVAYMVPNLLSLVPMVKWGHRVNVHLRIVGGFILFFIILVLVPAVDPAPNGFAFWVTMISIALAGFADAVVQGSVYGLAGLFPPHYTQAVMTGNGVAGVIVALSRIGTKLSFAGDYAGTRRSSIIYFVLSALFMAVCTVAYYVVLLRLPITKHFLNQNKYVTTGRRIDDRSNNNSSREIGRTDSGSLEMISLDDGNAAEDEADITKPSSTVPAESTPSSAVSTVDKMKNNFYQQTIMREWSTRKAVNHCSIMKQIWPYVISIVLVFTITLAVFPGMLVEIESSWNIGDWLPIILMSLFNVTDFIGKTIPRWLVLRKTSFVITVLRLLFLPLFFLCIYPRVLKHDLFPIFFVCAFGLTNGYCGSVVMMLAPTKVKAAEKEVVGIVMTFFLVLGLTIGACIAAVIKYTYIDRVG